MSSLATEIDQVMHRLAPEKATRLERLVRDGLALALADEESSTAADSVEQHQAWLARLEALRSSLAGKAGNLTVETILEDIRSERGE